MAKTINQLEFAGVTYEIEDSAARAAAAAGLQFILKDTLPTANAETYAECGGKIVLVPASQNGVQKNLKAEYVILRAGDETAYTYGWEKIGDTDLDLSEYSKKIHTHSVETNVTVGDHSYTPSGSNAASSVIFGTDGSTDTALGEATTFEASASDVTFDTAGHTVHAITSIGDSTVPAYSLGAATKKHITAIASGTSLNTETKYVASSATGGGSKTDGTAASLSYTSNTAVGSASNWNAGKMFKAEVSGKTLKLTEGSAPPLSISSVTGLAKITSWSPNEPTKVTLPSFSSQNIATGVKQDPTIELSDTAATGGVEVVTAQGTLATSGTNQVTFGALEKETALKSDVTATAAAQQISIGNNDLVTAITRLPTATAAAQKFTGDAASLSHSVTNNTVTTSQASN